MASVANVSGESCGERLRATITCFADNSRHASTGAADMSGAPSSRISRRLKP